jgi:Putative addiction module component
MLTLDQLISAATALPDAAKAILIEKIVESMTTQIDREILIEGVKKAQERMAEIVAQSKLFQEILPWQKSGNLSRKPPL